MEIRITLTILAITILSGCASLPDLNISKDTEDMLHMLDIMRMPL